MSQLIAFTDLCSMVQLLISHKVISFSSGALAFRIVQKQEMLKVKLWGHDMSCFYIISWMCVLTACTLLRVLNLCFVKWEVFCAKYMGKTNSFLMNVIQGIYWKLPLKLTVNFLLQKFQESSFGCIKGLGKWFVSTWKWGLRFLV